MYIHTSINVQKHKTMEGLMANNLKRVKFNKGDVIFKQGSFDTCMYDIVSGKVGVYANY